jgi:hypothetical protein
MIPVAVAFWVVDGFGGDIRFFNYWQVIFAKA